MTDSDLYMIVLDFLSQKYEIKYEENMSAQDVIRKIQKFLFPSEQNSNLIPSQNEKSYKKLRLYQTEVTNEVFKETSFVSWNITPDKLNLQKYRFFIFRPMINVFMKIYIVLPEKKDKKHPIGYLEIIYPIKKKGIVLKNYLKDKLKIYTKGKGIFKNNPIIGFELEFIDVDKSKPLRISEETYIEQWMNEKELYLIISPNSNINQNSCSLGRFYYFSYGHLNQAKSMLKKEGESLDYDERAGLTLVDAKKKLIEKHQAGNNYPEEKVVVTFNGVLQTYKFTRLDDLFSDNDFYQFIVIFESDINKHVSQISQSETERQCDLYVPESARPNIIKFEINGEPKPELRQRSLSSSNQSSVASLSDSSFANELSFTDSNSQSFTPESSIDDNNDLENNASSMVNDDEVINSNQVENNNNDNNNINIEDTSNDDDHINTVSNSSSSNANNFQPNENLDTKKENSDSFIDDDDLEDQNKTDEKDEDNLLDMFCYYFIDFCKEKRKFKNKTPHPTYFNSNNLSNEETSLINTFTKYYRLYRSSKQ